MKLKEIRTERLTLCEMNMDGWKDYISHIIEADEIYLQFCCEATDNLIDEIQEPTPGVLYYSIRKTDSNQRVGYIGIHNKNSNIEYHIYKEHRNNHYCTEALKAFLRAYMSGEVTGEKHEMVFGETHLENTPSCRVLENAGFKKEGVALGVGGIAARRLYLYTED